MADPAQGKIHEGGPVWTDRRTDELHPHLSWQLSPLFAVTGNATRDDIFPGGFPPQGSWGYMIEVEIRAIKPMTAELAGVVVSEVNIVARESDVTPRHPIIGREQDDTRHPHHLADQADGFIVRRRRKRAPTGKIKGCKLVIHRPGQILIEQNQRPFERGDVNRHKRAIEDQNTAT